MVAREAWMHEKRVWFNNDSILFFQSSFRKYPGDECLLIAYLKFYAFIHAQEINKIRKKSSNWQIPCQRAYQHVLEEAKLDSEPLDVPFHGMCYKRWLILENTDKWFL